MCLRGYFFEVGEVLAFLLMLVDALPEEVFNLVGAVDQVVTGKFGMGLQLVPGRSNDGFYGFLFGPGAAVAAGDNDHLLDILGT